MKKLFLIAFSGLLICACCSCHRFHHPDLSITVTEDEDVYKMCSYFDKSKTSKVQHFMDRQLGSRNNISFVGARMDDILTMKDQTTFYIKSSPANVEIKLDKDKNLDAGYAVVKQMCEGIKQVIEEE